MLKGAQDATGPPFLLLMTVYVAQQALWRARNTVGERAVKQMVCEGSKSSQWAALTFSSCSISQGLAETPGRSTPAAPSTWPQLRGGQAHEARPSSPKRAVNRERLASLPASLSLGGEKKTSRRPARPFLAWGEGGRLRVGGGKAT